MMTTMTAPGREQAMTVLAAELDVFLDLLRSLEPGDWAEPTDCPPWTVKDVAAHVLGQWEGLARLRVFLRRHRVGHRRYPDRKRLDAMTQQQVDELGDLPPAELIEKLSVVGPKALRVARRIPGPIRRLNGTRLFPEDPLPDPRFGYILDVLAARDTWMHRVDIATATGRPMVLGAHSGEIIALVLKELAESWTGPVTTLDVAGETRQLGAGEPVATIRAEPVDLLRTLAGRNDDPELEIDGDPAAAAALSAARVVF